MERAAAHLSREIFVRIPEAHGVRVSWDDGAVNDAGAAASESVPRCPCPFPVSYAPYRELHF